ncbi:oligogalacturonate-specific porin KdgM family protein [Celerinatantimonas sp. YJH-8]|uniref:oligogalacturonate-specific porin KdgM family protein n=1 Tax=Celerinatantimonas sp. YJH-8 TaxID=3228714 RepID=UPI0038C5C46D
MSRYPMVLSLCALATASVLYAGTVSATSLNLRHEYNKDSHASKDRFRIDHRFHNGVGIYVEAKYAHNDNSSLDDTRSNGHEAGVSYDWKYSKKFTVQPGFIMDSSSSAVTYKEQVKGTYKFTKNFSSALRYRYGLKVYSSNDRGDEPYHQFNWTGNYSFSWGKLGYDFEFKKYQDHVDSHWKGKSTDHLINLTGEYDKFESGWIPFWEVGMVTGKSNSSKKYNDEHQLRLRLGVKYNF